MFNQENPAGRLYTILSKLKHADGNSDLKHVWADALGIDRKNEIETLKQVFEIYNLTGEIEKLIRIRPGINHELLLASHSTVEKITSPASFHLRWHQVSKNLESDVLTRLQFCAQELSQFYEEEKVSDEEILEITEIVNFLFDELKNSQIDDAAKLVLLEEIERIRAALSHYRIRGAKGVKEALQATLGAVIVNKSQLEAVAKTNPDTIAKLGKLLDKLDSFSSKALKVHKALTKPVSYLLSFAKDDGDGKAT